jgi:hypothetical protein
MVKQDYIMRLISELIRTILKMVFKVDKNDEDELAFGDEAITQKYNGLLRLVDEGKINEAENILVDELDSSDIKQYQMALMFYSHVNSKDDDFLGQCDYAREEISEGISYVSQIYGYENLTTLFLNN